MHRNRIKLQGKYYGTGYIRQGRNKRGEIKMKSEQTEVDALKKEIGVLKEGIKMTDNEVTSIKVLHEKETSALKGALADLKIELENLRFEKDERIAGKGNGLEEYSQLALELVKLRTEVDRISYMHEREKRNTHMRDLEQQFSVESYWNEN